MVNVPYCYLYILWPEINIVFKQYHCFEEAHLLGVPRRQSIVSGVCLPQINISHAAKGNIYPLLIFGLHVNVNLVRRFNVLSLLMAKVCRQTFL